MILRVGDILPSAGPLQHVVHRASSEQAAGAGGIVEVVVVLAGLRHDHQIGLADPQMLLAFGPIPSLDVETRVAVEGRGHELRGAVLLHPDGGPLDRTFSKGDSQRDHHQQGEYIDPENRSRLADKLPEPRRNQLP